VAVSQSLASHSVVSWSITDQQMWGLWRSKSQRETLLFRFASQNDSTSLCGYSNIADTVPTDSVLYNCQGNDSSVLSIELHDMSALYSQLPVVTICTTSLTFNNSTFCPHCVFMCFVWI
jgi:hypothetical protein